MISFASRFESLAARRCIAGGARDVIVHLVVPIESDMLGATH